MGYSMQQRQSKFFIASEHKELALAAIKNLALTVQVNGRGSMTDRNGITRHYSWVDNNFANQSTFEAAMKSWRWLTTVNSNGDIVTIEFDSDRLGQELFLFAAIAPWVKEGSFIEMVGEDSAMWRWYFTGFGVLEQNAVVMWPTVPTTPRLTNG